MKTKKQILNDLGYALGKFDWGKSPLDAKAIDILNTIAGDIDKAMDYRVDFMADLFTRFMDTLPSKDALEIKDGDEYPLQDKVKEAYKEFLLRELESQDIKEAVDENTN